MGVLMLAVWIAYTLIAAAAAAAWYAFVVLTWLVNWAWQLGRWCWRKYRRRHRAGGFLI